MYHTTKWRHKRVKTLQRDKYMCQECKRYGKSVEAVTVHHIKPFENYPELAYDGKNLISLCGDCHNGMHDRNNGGLTATGQALCERIYR